MTTMRLNEAATRPMTSMLPPAAIYCRISDDDEGRALGVGRQEEDSLALADRLGFYVGKVDIYIDNDVSASTLSKSPRPEYDRMLEAVRAGKYKYIIAYSNSRLTRRVRELLDLIDLHKETGVVIHTVVSGSDDLSTADGRMVALYKATADQAEAERVSERVLRKIKSKRDDGDVLGGTRPFGWMPDKIKADPVEAHYARQMVSMFSSGQSLHAIARWLKSEGVKSTRGNDWTMDALRKYLGNPRLCGWRKYNGELVRDKDGNPVVGKWDALISSEDWLACEERLSERRGKQFGPKGATGVLAPSFDARKYLLTGFLRCGKHGADGPCMARLRGTQRADLSGGFIYQCVTPTQGGCAGVGRNGAVLDAYITEVVLARSEALAGRAETPDTTWSEQAALDGAVARRKALTDRWTAGQMEDAHYFDTLETLDVTIRQLRADRDSWEGANALLRNAPTDIRSEWDKRHDDLGWKRSVIEAHIRSIIVEPTGGGRRPFNPDKVRIIWRETE